MAVTLKKICCKLSYLYHWVKKIYFMVRCHEKVCVEKSIAKAFCKDKAY